jgi:formate dehydrogenase alpha subunit
MCGALSHGRPGPEGHAAAHARGQNDLHLLRGWVAVLSWVCAAIRLSVCKGDRDNPVNGGSLCVKGQIRLSLHQSPRTPAKTADPKRRGAWLKQSGDEALALIADQILLNIRGEQFAALASARITNEDNYLIQKFTRAVMGTNTIDHCARL